MFQLLEWSWVREGHLVCRLQFADDVGIAPFGLPVRGGVRDHVAMRVDCGQDVAGVHHGDAGADASEEREEQAEAVWRPLEPAWLQFGGELGREVEEERERGGRAVRGEAGVGKFCKSLGMRYLNFNL